MLSHSDVIEAFGGIRPLATAIGVKPALAIHWPRRGIPAKFWPKVEVAARNLEQPLAVTAELLMTLPATPARAA